MACSSAVQSRDMPGLCFMARAAPEVSGAEDDTTCVCSWWFPDGFAIHDETINPFFPSNASNFKLYTKGLSELTVTSRQLPWHAQHHEQNWKGGKYKLKKQTQNQNRRERSAKAIVVRVKEGNRRER